MNLSHVIGKAEALACLFDQILRDENLNLSANISSLKSNLASHVRELNPVATEIVGGYVST